MSCAFCSMFFAAYLQSASCQNCINVSAIYLFYMRTCGIYTCTRVFFFFTYFTCKYALLTHNPPHVDKSTTYFAALSHCYYFHYHIKIVLVCCLCVSAVQEKKLNSSIIQRGFCTSFYVSKSGKKSLHCKKL